MSHVTKLSLSTFKLSSIKHLLQSCFVNRAVIFENNLIIEQCISEGANINVQMDLKATNNDAASSSGTPMHTGVKRLHSALSPGDDEKTSQSTLDRMCQMQTELMNKMSAISEQMTSMDQKIKKVATKDDLTKLTEDLATVNSKVSVLEEENKALKAALDKVVKEQEDDRKKLRYLEEHAKKNTLIFRNIPTKPSAQEAVQSVCKNYLKMKNKVEIVATRWISEKDAKMTVSAEFGNESTVDDILKSTKNLAGLTISISRDLSNEKLQQKKAMLQLRKRLLAIDENKQIQVRDYKLKVDRNGTLGTKKNNSLPAKRMD